MSLFTDGPMSTIDDLRTHENHVLEVATTELVDVESKLRASQNMVASALSTFLARGSQAHALDQQLTLKNVCVTEPLRQWHVFQTLHIVYRDMYGNQLSERYAQKAQEYGRLAAWASEMLFHAGVGLVREPIPKPSRPELSVVPAATGEASVVVSVSWTGPGACLEGTPSDPVAITVPSGKTLEIRMGDAPVQVSGWNVFVGRVADQLTRQNEIPLEAEALWRLPVTGLVAGPKPGRGQSPDWYFRPDQVLQRG